MATKLNITGITEYMEPKPYLAIECDQESIKELSLKVFFDYVFKHNQALKEYAEKVGFNEPKLYKHIQDLGIDTKDLINEILTTDDIDYEFINVPAEYYPLFRKVYTGVANGAERALVNEITKQLRG